MFSSLHSVLVVSLVVVTACDEGLDFVDNGSEEPSVVDMLQPADGPGAALEAPDEVSLSTRLSAHDDGETREFDESLDLADAPRSTKKVCTSGGWKWHYNGWQACGSCTIMPNAPMKRGNIYKQWCDSCGCDGEMIFEGYDCTFC